MKKTGLIIFLIVTSVLFNGCLRSFPQPTTVPDANLDGLLETSIASTVIASMAQSSPTPLPSNTPEPVVATATQPEPTPTATNTPVSENCYRVKFVTDISVGDGAWFGPGISFVKTWRLQNNGTCAWSSDTMIQFQSGTLMASEKEIPLGVKVDPGETVDVSLNMVTPGVDGKYTSNWMLKAPSGEVYGLGEDKDTPFWAVINVGTATYDDPSGGTTGSYEMHIDAWPGKIVSGKPGGAGDYIVLYPKGTGEVGLEGNDSEIDDLIDKNTDSDKIVYVWGKLVCGIVDHNGCRIEVKKLVKSNTEWGPNPIQDWEGKIIVTKYNGSKTYAFVLAGDFPITYGLTTNDSDIEDRLNNYADSGKTIYLDGNLYTGANTVNGLRIQVTDITK